MPNRTLRDGALHSERINSVSRDAEWLFYRLIQAADDFGLYEASGYAIKSKIAGARRETPAQLERWQAELAEQELVLLYTTATGRQLGALNKWEQRRSAKYPKFPLPPWGLDHVTGGYVAPRARTDAAAQGSVTARPEALSAPLTPAPAAPTSKPKPNGDAGFAAFYESYPRHTGRAAAERAWKRLHPDEPLRATIAAAVERQRAWWSDPQFIPHPATWINGKRWEDEQPQALANGAPADGKIKCMGCGERVSTYIDRLCKPCYAKR